MIRELLDHNPLDGERRQRALASDIGIAVSILAVFLFVPSALAAVPGFLWGGIPGAVDAYREVMEAMLAAGWGFYLAPGAFATLYGAAVLRVLPTVRGTTIAFLAHSKLVWLANDSEIWIVFSVLVVVPALGLTVTRRLTAYLDGDLDDIAQQTVATDGGEHQ